MKQFLLILAFLFAVATPAVACDNPACKCEDCKCVNCDECCKTGQAVTPVDDSKSPVLMVVGSKNDATYQTYVKWAQATTSRYHAVTTDSPMYAERYAGTVPVTPKVIIVENLTGKVLYKGNPISQAELGNRWRNSCPDGNCRPRNPEPAPVQPAPAPIAPVAEPIPDTDDSSGLAWYWYVLAAVGGVGAGGYSWWKKEYFSA